MFRNCNFRSQIAESFYSNLKNVKGHSGFINFEHRINGNDFAALYNSTQNKEMAIKKLNRRVKIIDKFGRLITEIIPVDMLEVKFDTTKDLCNLFGVRFYAAPR